MWVINWTLSQVSDFSQGNVNVVVDRVFKAFTLTPQAVLLAGQLTTQQSRDQGGSKTNFVHTR